MGGDYHLPASRANDAFRDTARSDPESTNLDRIIREKMNGCRSCDELIQAVAWIRYSKGWVVAPGPVHYGAKSCGCPLAPTLLQYDQQRLPPAMHKRVDDHLRRCDMCRVFLFILRYACSVTEDREWPELPYELDNREAPTYEELVSRSL